MNEEGGTGDQRLRVLVVHGSKADREALVRVLGMDTALEVVGSVSDWPQGGRAGWRKPDIIMMDLDDRRSLDESRRIMHDMPTPIVMVTHGAPNSHRELLAEAKSAGALAIVTAPTADCGSKDVHRALLSTVKNMARVKVVRQRGGLPASPAEGSTARPRPGSANGAPALVAIGASTGGPPALRDLLTALPETFPIPIVVVQHMAAGFVGSLLDWLTPQCRLPVHLARSGVLLDHPAVHVAPTGEHVVVRGSALHLSDAPPVSGQRPSVTVLFQSVAAAYGSSAVGVLLTGMGDDGAAGLQQMKQAGATTVVQDEASSVIYGMPGAAIRLDAATHLLPPSAIAALLVELVQGKRKI